MVQPGVVTIRNFKETICYEPQNFLWYRSQNKLVCIDNAGQPQLSNHTWRHFWNILKQEGHMVLHSRIMHNAGEDAELLEYFESKD